MEKVRFGIIGAGNQGTYYTGLFHQELITNGVLTALADTNVERAKKLAEKYPEMELVCFKDYKEMLESGLCDMYRNLGHENLCLTCRKFPRFTNAFGSRIETGISLSCPEAARLIFKNADPVTFETEETGAEIIPSDFDAELYFTLLDARKKAIEILQQRNFSIEQRICAFLEFSQTVQQLINEDRLEDEKNIFCDEYLNRTYPHSPAKAKRALSKYFSDFGSLEFIGSDFTRKLSKAQSVDTRGFQAPDWEYEHLMIYFVFRYFITAAYDGDLLTKSKIAALSFIMIKRLHTGLDAYSKEQRTEISQKYSKEIVPSLMEKHSYKSVMEVPKLEKIVVNMGVGDATVNSKNLENAVKELEKITGLKAVETTAKKSIASFKVREGHKIGCKVTLRGDKMYNFLDKLISISLPRVRDFRGLSPKSFDGRGNYTIGIKEQIIFPEINFDEVEKVRGMDVVIVTTAKTNEEAFDLLKELGVPFRK